MKLQHFWLPDQQARQLPLPVMLSHLSAGFPSPADDFLENRLDLNDYLVQHPAATIFAWANGQSLQGLGIDDGDLLVIDRALTPRDGSVVVAALGGELTCKILDCGQGQLRAANDAFAPIPIADNQECLIEGVVTFNIKKHT